jgi:N-acetylglucosaminyldiphosphoundecaprenol N-acetyl-beta-D-mannosaminyltransferase
MTLPVKTPVVGTPISMTSYDEVLETLSTRRSDRALTVAVCNVHSVMSARKDPSLRSALDSADIATPDGVPLVWGIRWTADPGQERVYGPELMVRSLVASGTMGWRHYLYGSTPETLVLLETAIAELAPQATIVGTESPPFRELTDDEEEAVLDRIRDSGAEVVWVGLGMPKQELWMSQVASRLPGVALLGVGAAFDFLAGTKRQAPAWMQRAGLEWLFRFIQEPGRLWRRYLWNNPAYLVLLARQVITSRLRGRSVSTPRGS